MKITFYPTAIAILSVVLIGAIAEVARSLPLNLGSRYPIVTEAEINTPICYIQTKDGSTLDLSSLCNRAVINNRNVTTASANVRRLLQTKQCPGCDLSGANLANANLGYANLMSANLSGADLSGATLVGANMSSANLAGANLQNAKLNGARMTSANLNGAKLTGATLLGANLFRADLNGVQMDGTRTPDGGIIKESISY